MTDSVRIIPVHTVSELKRFINLPWKIYRGEKKYPNWVPPLLIDEKFQFNRGKNPFYHHAESEFFLAERDGKISGRIAAIIDRNYISFQEDNAGFFGYFESFDDPDVARALFDAAGKWLRERGVVRILGPMNPSTNEIIGCLIDSFDIPPIVKMGYNADYLPSLIEGSGLTKEKDLRAYRMDTSLRLSDKIVRVSEIVRKRHNVTIRTINMKRFKEDVEIIRDIYNQGWSKNWGFTPWTKEEFDHAAADLKMIAVPELVLLVYVNGVPAGVSIPLPDINQILIKMNGRLLPAGLFKLLAGKKKIDVLRMAILGVRREFHNKGLDAVMIHETYIRGEKLGFKGCELSWILEDNMSLVNMLESWGAEYYRTYRVYSRRLDN